MRTKDVLINISPIDGRYSSQTSGLTNYFSEFALFKYRVFIELKYLIFLSKIGIVRKISLREVKNIEKIFLRFSLKDANKIKKYEAITKHDVKAVEYYLRTRLSKDLLPWIHFGLTSYDINDNAYRLMIKDSLHVVLLPQMRATVKFLNSISKQYMKLSMLGRTHGQPAVPTTFGKELQVFVSRLKKEIQKIEQIELYGKFGGAVGNWNSLSFVFPNKDWKRLSGRFLKKLGLLHSTVTTQVDPSEDMIEIFQCLFRFNNILIDFNQDMWRYISDNWVVQKGKEKDVGSSTMPQKINPIEFENSEGNLVMANGLFETFSRKLPISRLQRDLSDSTVLRNIGTSFAHCLVAYKSCIKGIESISPNKEKILIDLNENWSILTEALQTLLRKEGNTNAYEKIAIQIRGKEMKKDDWIALIDSLDISDKGKTKLKKLTPENYIGLVKK